MKKALSFLLSLLMILSVPSPALVSAGAVSTLAESAVDADDAIVQQAEGDAKGEGGVTLENGDVIHRDKNLITDEDGNLGLQIDIWTEGTITNEPTELVFIVDQSGSMFQAADGKSSYFTYRNFVNSTTLNFERGRQFPGYYVAITPKPNNKPDWNGNYYGYTPYISSLLKYTDDGWQRTPHVYQEQYQYDGLLVNPVLGNFDQIDYRTLTTDNFSNTKAKYFKSLYGATIDAYYALLEEVKSIQNLKVAVVGFSTPRGYGNSNNYGGTGIFKDGEFIHANDLTEQDYKNAWHSTGSQESMDNLTASMNGIFTNYSGTCTEDGFIIANEIFAQSDNPDANRVVILFTDGAPTGISTDTGWVSYQNYEAYNYALLAANRTKNEFNAKVYAYGPANYGGITTAEANDMKKFMQNVSSNYPQSTSMTNNGGVTQSGYFDVASDSAALEEAFKEIGHLIFLESSALKKDAVVRDIVTKYFNIDGDFNGGDIKVFDVPYVELADGTLCFEENENNWVDITNEVTLTVEGQTVSVTNYDFPESSINPQRAGGNKLVIQIPIVRDPEFIGGNQVETNTPDSGIYKADGQPAAYFPVPDTDVTLTEITAQIADMNIYLGSDMARNFTVSDLKDTALVTINGFVLDLSKPDEDYGLDWQDDYVDVDVVITDDKGNEFVGGFEDLREDTVYSIKVTVDPIYEGRETTIGHSNTADIIIFYPELTFHDSYHMYGDNVPTDDMMSITNWLSAKTKWKNADGVYSDTVVMDSTVVPEFDFSYTLAHEGDVLDEMNIPVNVTVNTVGYAADVEKYCYFIWEPCDPDCGFTLENHDALEVGYEFYLHMRQGVVPDSVVIDYGLPVKITVLSNDKTPKDGQVTAIGTALSENTQVENVAYASSRLTDGVESNLVLSNGTASISGNQVVYTPTNLEMSTENVFYYEYKNADGEYYYATVTVIPAANIYYEDSFFTFNDGNGYTWKTAGETLAEKFQAEDRVGSFSFEAADEDNVYGYDSAYNDSYTYSLGSSKYTTVDSKVFGKEPTAEFTFCGTGFDLFSVTNSDTGAIQVMIYKANSSSTKPYKNYLVQTYYGYSYEEDAFVPNPDSTDSLYQVPVISAHNLGYDTYRVVIKPLYSSAFDPKYDKTEGAVNSYDIYIDSVRIYNPAGEKPDTDSVIGGAHLQDGEYAPEYLELREHILSANDFYDQLLEGTEFGKGSVFIDGVSSLDGSGLSDKFLEAGANNEVYLAKGQAIAFYITSDSPVNLSSVQLGMKVVKAGANNAPSNVVIMNTNDLVYNKVEVRGAGEMYRRLDPVIVWETDALNESGKYQTKYPIVVANTSDSVVALTKFKWAYAAPPEASAVGFSLAVTSETPAMALLATRAAMADALFNDECIELSWAGTNFIEGDTATLSVTTPAQVVGVTVDGAEVTEFSSDANGNKVWTYAFEVTKIGENVFDVVLFDEYGSQSEPIQTESITVVKRTLTSEDIEIIWSDAEFKEGKEATVVVTTPAGVEKITVDGVEVTEFELNEDGTKRWEYTFELKKAGENSYEILLYDAEGAISEPIATETITVNEKTLIEKIIEFFIRIFKVIWWWL